MESILPKMLGKHLPLFSAMIAVVIWCGVLDMADTFATLAHSPSVEFTKWTWATSGLVDRLVKVRICILSNCLEIKLSNNFLTVNK